MEINKHIGEGFGKGELYDTLIALQLESGLLPISGVTYFVSQMGNNTTGLSWETAFATLSAAVTASNTFYDAYGTSRISRNRIFVDGTNYAGLTVLPKHCDIIGVGTNSRINAASKVETAVDGCHIYNMKFRCATAAPMFWATVATNGLEFHNCLFENSSSASTIGLQLYGNTTIKINNCKFSGYGVLPIGIQIDKSFITSEMIGNTIFASSKGISITANVLTLDYHSIIKDNIIGNVLTTAQLAVGIDILSEGCTSRIMLINNYISAVDAIHFTGAGGYEYSRDECMCINNHINQAGVGTIEAPAS